MDIQTLLLEINRKLNLLLKAQGIDHGEAANEHSDNEADTEYGRELARQMGSIRSDEK